MSISSPPASSVEDAPCRCSASIAVRRSPRPAGFREIYQELVEINTTWWATACGQPGPAAAEGRAHPDNVQVLSSAPRRQPVARLAQRLRKPTF
jgi:hypothetical protein